MIWRVVEIEVKENVVLVFGVPMRALMGLGIGSPLSQGGAILCASYTEHLMFAGMRIVIQTEIMSRTLIRRWLDDLFIVAANNLSREAAAYLATQKSPFFYGPSLEPKKVRGPEPFGFLAIITEKGLVLRSKLSFIMDGRHQPEGGWQKRRTGFHGGPQFRSERTTQAVLSGHIYRYVDMSMEDREGVQHGLRRLMLELVESGFREHQLQSALRKAEGCCSFDVKSVAKVLEWPRLQRRSFCALYDELELALRTVMMTRLLLEEFSSAKKR